MVFCRSIVVLAVLTLGRSCTDAFSSPFRSFVKKTYLSALPDSLDIPEFQSGNVESSPSIESMVGKVAASVSESISISDITDTVPQIPDVVASTPAAALSVPAAVVSAPAASFPTELLPVALGVVAIAAIAAFVAGKSDKEVAAPKPTMAATPTSAPAPTSLDSDLSIPYDAAARLAYGSGDEAGFAAFKKKYEDETVKMVIEKKKARGTGY